MQSKYHAITHKIQGRSHIKSETPCQDYAHSHITNEVAIITLADGAGSAKYSHFGAECVTKKTADILEKNFDNYYNATNDEVKNSIAEEIINTLNKELEELSDKKTKELKPNGYKKIQEIIINIQNQMDKIKSIDTNKHTEKIDSIKTSLNNNKSKINKDLDHINNELKDYKNDENDRLNKLEALEVKMCNTFEDYEYRINDARQSLRKIIKKREKHGKSLIKKIFKVIKDFIYGKSNDLTIQETQEYKDEINEYKKAEKEVIDRLSQNKDSLKQKVNRLSNTSNKKDRDNIFKQLDEYAQAMRREIENIYEKIESILDSLKKGLKSDSDKLEKEHLNINSHILSIRDDFLRIIKEISIIYKNCIDKEKEYKKYLKDEEANKQKELSTLDSNIGKCDELKRNIESSIQKFKDKINNFNNELKKLKEKNQDEFYKKDDIESIYSCFFQPFHDSLNKIKKIGQMILDHARQCNIPQHNIQVTQSIDDIDFDREKILKIIDDSICSIKDLSSTLLFVVIKDERCLIGHLGDGAIGALYGDKLQVVTNPDNGEHSNETFFITTKNAHKALKFIKGNVKEKDIKAFMLMSDGSTEGLYSKKDKKFIEALQRHVIEITKQDKDKKQKDIEELIQKVRETKSFDDCSIAILAMKDLKPIAKENNDDTKHDKTDKNQYHDITN